MDSQLAQWRESKKIYKSNPTGTIEQKEKQVKKIQPLTKKNIYIYQSREGHRPIHLRQTGICKTLKKEDIIQQRLFFDPVFAPFSHVYNILFPVSMFFQLNIFYYY